MMKIVASPPAFEFEASGSKFDFDNEKTIVSSEHDDQKLYHVFYYLFL